MGFPQGMYFTATSFPYSSISYSNYQADEFGKYGSHEFEEKQNYHHLCHVNCIH
uniref:Uncharacterized protein n=1 Tax=Arundo donax TaxID=35708 RepID=A0A0A8ZCI4_ARUDO